MKEIFNLLYQSLRGTTAQVQVAFLGNVRFDVEFECCQCLASV